MIPWYLWLLIALVAFVGEAFTLSLLLGSVAVAALLAAALTTVAVWPVQVGAFAAATLILIFAVRPAALRILPGHDQAADVPRIGPHEDRGIAMERIDSRRGQIRVGNSGYWSARTLEEDQVVEPGAEVEILGTEGLEVLVRPLISVVPPPPPNPEDLHPWGLSARELEVLELVAAGMSNQEIAENLILSPRTVHHHVSHILNKMNVDRRVDAVRLSIEAGVVKPRTKRR